MADSPGVGNAISGTAAGPVVQAGSIQQVVLSPTRHESLPVPRQLPAGLRDFVGRKEQLAALDALLSDSDSAGGGAVVAVVEGTGGGGKTTVVVQWAHRVQAEFPDGTLFVNLRGYGPSAPLRPEIVLTSFLSALGMPEPQIPAELDAQAGLYRSLLAERRVLVVLDNACDAEQVRPLLPGTSGCMVLVTGRANLTDLVISVAAHRVNLDLFTTTESQAMLRGGIGPARADAEPAAVTDLVRLCGGLPLAVRIAATRAAARPRYSLADMVADISEEQSPSPGTTFGEGVVGGAVRSVFDWSYSQLTSEHARVFRALGLHPGPEFGVDAVAALTGLDPVSVYRCMELMTELHLVEPAGRKRYRMHDLLYAYAASRAELDDSSSDRQKALRRVLNWYARTAYQADRAVCPALKSIAPDDDTQAGPEIVFTDYATAMTWLHLERANLVSAVRRAAAANLNVLAMSLAVACRFLTISGAALSSLHLEVTELGLASAVAAGDQAAEVMLLDLQAVTFRQTGRLEEAEVTASRTLALAERTNDPARLVSGLSGLGRTRLKQGRLQEARHYYERSSSVARESGLKRPEAVALCNLSGISVQLGEFERALEEAERCMQLRRQVDDPIGETGALVDIALALQGLDRHDTAISLCRQAIAGYQKLEYAGVDLADTFLPLATSLEHLGDFPAAAQALADAFSVLTALEDPRAAETHARLTNLQTRIALGQKQNRNPQ